VLSPDGVERSRSAGVVTVVVSGGIAGNGGTMGGGRGATEDLPSSGSASCCPAPLSTAASATPGRRGGPGVGLVGTSVATCAPALGHPGLQRSCGQIETGLRSLLRPVSCASG